MISSCPICDIRVLTAELEQHANSHFEEDDQLQRDMELAHQIALAESTTQTMSQSSGGPERFTGDSTNAQGTSSIHGGGGYDGESELLDQQISCLVGAQLRSNAQEIQGGIMTLLRSCLESEPGSSTTSIISRGHVDHHPSLASEDKGWGCGWRNIQMLSSHLLKQRPEARRVLFGGSGFVPDIPSLQRWLEIAWDRGFDTVGSSHFHNNVYGAKKWVGTTECAAIFRSFGLRARIVDFDSTESSSDVQFQSKNGKRPAKSHQVRGPMDNFVIKNTPAPAKSSSSQEEEEAESVRGRQVLVDWVWNYFATGCSDRSGMQQRVTVSNKTPLYFQHQGHSRTIVGIQKKKAPKGSQDQYTLLILDPGHKTADLERTLRSKKGWQSLVKRGVHTLKKPQYQLCYVDPGIANSEEMEQLKTIDSILVRF